jgi:hypothetical protein
MRLLLLYLAALLGVAYGNRVQAQEQIDIRFADFLERLPKPMATLDETMAAYGSYERMENEMKYVNKEINESLTVIYTPLLELFQKRTNNKAQWAGLSKEEREMLQGFITGSIGISESNRMNAFKLLMDYNRPLISSSKLSWTKIHPSASANVQKLYQQLKAVEGQLDWAGFTKQAESYRPKFGEADDENLKAVHQKFDEAFKKLPKKKVKVMEGFYNEVEDPDKAIALLEQHRTDFHQAFEKQYAVRYKWWTGAYEKLSVMSQRLDAIASETSAVISNEADRSVKLAIADLQGRTWEAWQRLSAVAQGLFINTMIAAAAKGQVDSSIEIYRKYKESGE